MEFINFVQIIEKEIKNRKGEECEVSVKEELKNNGFLCTGIMISPNEVNIAPTIYLDDYYELYLDGRMTMDEVVEEVLRIYENKKLDESIAIEFFTDFEQVKDKVTFMLVNYEMNKERLKDLPHIRILDLAIVFQCLVKVDQEGNAYILIHHAHLKLWEKSVEEIYKLARENTPQMLPCEIQKLYDVVLPVFKNSNMDVDEDALGKIPLFILSNQVGQHGAGVILYKDVLKDFAEELKGDLLIIPSSVHEVLIMRQDENQEVKCINQMIEEINQTQLSQQDILSDHVYFYERDKNQILTI